MRLGGLPYGRADRDRRAGRAHRGGDGPATKNGGQYGFKPGSDGRQEAGACTGLTSTGREKSTVISHDCVPFGNRLKPCGDNKIEVGRGTTESSVSEATTQACEKLTDRVHFPSSFGRQGFVDSIGVGLESDRRKGPLVEGRKPLPPGPVVIQQL